MPSRIFTAAHLDAHLDDVVEPGSAGKVESRVALAVPASWY
jgi:hypothetical protein